MLIWVRVRTNLKPTFFTENIDISYDNIWINMYTHIQDTKKNHANVKSFFTASSNAKSFYILQGIFQEKPSNQFIL